MTLEKTLPVISSTSTIVFQAKTLTDVVGETTQTATKAVTWDSNFFTISSHLSFTSTFASVRSTSSLW